MKRFLFLISSFFAARSFSQTPDDSVVAIASKAYQRSSLHNFFWGKHYRQEWIAPVTAKKIYIDRLKINDETVELAPSKEGGGRQTHSLRLSDKNGKEYVLRSVDKTYAKALPDIYQGTFITRIAKDQASTVHPYAAMTVLYLLEKTDIYHPRPVLVYLPRQEKLGKYNEEYGNQLYFLEERPDGNQEKASHFGFSKNLIGTDKLFDRIYKDNDNHVDQSAFVKARLFDMFVGDWGRNPDNWRWAEFDEGKQNIYKPVPRDRDQTWSIYDGLLPSIAVSIGPGKHLESFSPRIKNIRYYNYAAWAMDGPFTNALTEQDWIHAAKELQSTFTDPVVYEAAKQLPPSIFAISGEKITRDLKLRRDNLEKYAKDYYKHLARDVDVYGSNDKELFEINRINSDQTQINVYKITRENEIKDKPFYSRIFLSKETNEIRLYGLDKTDVYKITGKNNSGIRIRVIDPQGIDSFATIVDDKTKISFGKKFRIDSFHVSKFNLFPLPFFSPPEYKPFENDPLPLFVKTGLRISVNMRYNGQPWKKPEYKIEHLISANYGILRKVFNIGYVGTFGRLVGNWDLLLKARYDAPARENFFGVGNETIKLSSDVNFYKTLSRRLYTGVELRRAISSHHEVEACVFYQTIKIKEQDGHFISNPFIIDHSVFNNKKFGGIETGYHFRKTDNDIYPRKGFDFAAAAGHVGNLDENRSFKNFNGSFAFYLPVGNPFTLAVRAGAATTTGEADFYHLNKLGGYVNLRGYRRERFTGKTAFYNNNELRWLVNTRNFIFNGKIGLLGFFDEGRIWQPGEASNTIHTGYGGGLIVVPFNKVTLTATYCVSKEDKLLQLKAGLFF